MSAVKSPAPLAVIGGEVRVMLTGTARVALSNLTVIALLGEYPCPWRVSVSPGKTLTVPVPALRVGIVVSSMMVSEITVELTMPDPLLSWQ